MAKKGLFDLFGGDLGSIVGSDLFKEAMEKARGVSIEQEEAKNVQAQKDVEKRRIQEKQIRALRSQYRPQGGFLGGQGLGGEATKLGTM